MQRRIGNGGWGSPSTCKRKHTGSFPSGPLPPAAVVVVFRLDLGWAFLRPLFGVNGSVHMAEESQGAGTP